MLMAFMTGTEDRRQMADDLARSRRATADRSVFNISLVSISAFQLLRAPSALGLRSSDFSISVFQLFTRLLSLRRGEVVERAGVFDCIRLLRRERFLGTALSWRYLRRQVRPDSTAGRRILNAAS